MARNAWGLGRHIGRVTLGWEKDAENQYSMEIGDALYAVIFWDERYKRWSLEISGAIWLDGKKQADTNMHEVELFHGKLNTNNRIRALNEGSYELVQWIFSNAHLE